ncbi:MAG: GNAT family N-acetyltransferase [Chloroflexota bacterium]
MSKEKQAVKVRPAQIGDATRIATLCTDLGYPAIPEQIKHRLKSILPEDDHAIFVAELPERQVIGWVHVCLRKLVVAEQQAEIEGLVVDKALRCQGVGRLLMEEAERWGRNKKCTCVYLRSNVNRNEAHAFYESIGYNLIKTQRAYKKSL